MAHLERIQIFPIKSLDPEILSESVMLPGGALEYDRLFGLMDNKGECINGKLTAAVHLLRTHYDGPTRRLELHVEGQEEKLRFDVDAERDRLIEWFAGYFRSPIEIYENPDGGFPDDFRFPGPTVVSTATLETVASWFPGLTLESVRRRIRANLEVGGVEPFWEDRLLAPGMGNVRFRVGPAELLGANPCARCVVPSRDPWTGETIREFSKTFTRRREETLPDWAPTNRFDHFFRIAVNTLPGAGDRRTIRVGDAVEILGIE